MYIDTSHLIRGGKTYTRHLLRESYRANGKVLHRTLASVIVPPLRSKRYGWRCDTRRIWSTWGPSRTR